MKICFVISSIGSIGSIERQRSDALLERVIKPVLEEELDYKVIRADEITAPNNIHKDIIKHLEEDTLVIADVHDTNPNVFYELGVRNVIYKPYILLGNPHQKLSFDIHNNRAIDHPFPEENFDGANISQETLDQIEKTKKLLKKFVKASEDDPESAAEAITENLELVKQKKEFDSLIESEKLKQKKQKEKFEESITSANSRITKQKKYFRSVMILSAIAIIFVFVILSNNTISIEKEYQNQINEINTNHNLSILEKQIASIESTVYNNVDNIIFSTDTVEEQIVYMYDLERDMLHDLYEPDKVQLEFIKKLKEGNFQGIFAEEYRTTPISAYVYVMEPGPDCEFVLYAYIETMERGNGELLESCSEMYDTNMYLTSLYPSTGTDDYVFAIAKTLNFDANDSKFDLIVSTAVHLGIFSDEIKSKIDLDDVRFVLTDRDNQIVFDCNKETCFVDYNIYAENQGKEFGAESKPIIFNSTVYADYPKYIDYPKNNTNILSSEKLQGNRQNSILIDGWTLHVFHK